MNKFSIRDIEMLSGIKAHTFRIWEQRHGLCFCKRKDSQHRYYDNDDLKAVLRIAYLYHHGYKISKIVGLSKDEVIKLANGTIDECNYDRCIHQLLEASIDYDQPLFDKIIQQAILRFGFDNAILRVFYPLMQKVGLLWVTEHVIPAQEHFSSCLIQQKILVAIEKLVSPQLNQKDTVLIFAPEQELHEIPLLVAQYHFKKNGIKTAYFGINVTIPQIEYFCVHKRITHLYLHAITNFSNKGPDAYIQCLLSRFPGLKIIASGPAFRNVQLTSDQAKIAHTVEDLIPVFSSFL